jgi:thiol-disulfide isomerase/thioredoxin
VTARFTLLLALLCWSVGTPLPAQSDGAGIALGTTPPPAAIETLEGKPVELSQVINSRPALIEFWATWCSVCRALEPKVAAAYARYGARVQFIAVAVGVNETAESVRRHLDRNPMPYPYLWDGHGNAVRAFEAPTTSFVVIVNARGKVVYTGVGADQDIEAALGRAVAAD